MPSNKLAIYVHFVWSTWDRLPLVDEHMRRPLYRYIWTICQELKCNPIAVGGTEDHVHLLVELSNTITIADLIRRVKSSSSYFVSETLKPGEWFAWQGSYGAFSVTARDRTMITDYINNQQEHHATGKIWPSMEAPSKTSSSTQVDDPAEGPGAAAFSLPEQIMSKANR